MQDGVDIVTIRMRVMMNQRRKMVMAMVLRGMGIIMVALGTVMVVEATVEMVTGVETEVVENEKGY